FSRPRAQRRPRHFIRHISALVLASTTCLLAQHPTTSIPPARPPQENPRSNPDASTPRQDSSRQTLAQFNDALEALAAKVSPAVVQILVTGYGALHEEARTQTALIVRQHA